MLPELCQETIKKLKQCLDLLRSCEEETTEIDTAYEAISELLNYNDYCKNFNKGE